MSRTTKKKLTGAKAVSHQCRNNGTCPWCLGNRMYKHLKKLLQYERTRTDNTE
jgi:hypothetical protein